MQEQVCPITKTFIKSCSLGSRNETNLTSEISFPTDSLLAQLAERETDDLEVVGSILSRRNFFILLFSVNDGRILPRFGRK